MTKSEIACKREMERRATYAPLSFIDFVALITLSACALAELAFDIVVLTH